MKVAIVGTGLSGLATGLHLKRTGAEIVFFEARDRVGGRAWTVLDWLYEAGGEWIDSDHHRFIDLASRYGLTLDPAPGRRGGVWKGEYRPTYDLWPEAKAAEMRLESLAHEGWQEGATLADLIEEAGAGSDLARWWLTANLRSDEGVDPDQVGLSEWLAFYRQYAEREGGEVSALRVRGGIGQMVDAMLVELEADVRFETPVREIRQADDGVWIDGERFDGVVVAIPPRCVELITFDPPLEDQRRAALDLVGMAPIVKVVWKEEEVAEGNTLWDTDLQQTWSGSRGATSVLTAYICGRDAMKIHEHGASHLRDGNGRLHDWIGDPWAQGGFPYTKPGLLPVREELRKPHGRAVFAGDYAADWMGFYEGALESAERAAAQALSCFTA